MGTVRPKVFNYHLMSDGLTEYSRQEQVMCLFSFAWTPMDYSCCSIDYYAHHVIGEDPSRLFPDHYSVSSRKVESTEELVYHWLNKETVLIGGWSMLEHMKR